MPDGRYRSTPWLYQCFARASRALPGKQGGYIFTPDDPFMKEVVEAIKLEQGDYAIETLQATRTGGNPPGGNGAGPSPAQDDAEIIPLGSKMTTRHFTLRESWMIQQNWRRLLMLQERHGLSGYSPLQLKRFALDLGMETAVVEDEAGV